MGNSSIHIDAVKVDEFSGPEAYWEKDSILATAPLNIAITAGTLTGNRGAEAMVTTCINRIHEKFPSAHIHVLTYYPTADRNEKRDGRVLVHSSTPKQLVLNWFPLSLLAFMFRFLKRKPQADGEGMLALLGVDAVLDVAGVSFIDGREKFLPFNVLTLLPFIINGVPVFKMAQALGPITSPLNRLASGLVLKRLKLVVARGAQTYKYLEEYGLRPPQITQSSDISFELQARQKVPYSDRAKIVYFGPSSLVESQADGYVENLSQVCDGLINRGYTIKLLAHSWRADTDAPRNNDVPVCRRLAELVKRKTGVEVEIVGPGMTALELKEAIAKSQMFVTSRFHGMIAALSTETPVVVLGWSHKYQEVLDVFGLANCGLKFAGLTAEALNVLCDETLRNGSQISHQISTHLPQVVSSCRLVTESVFDSIIAGGRLQAEHPNPSHRTTSEIVSK